MQNPGQLDRDYKEAARIIKGGCTATVYLGAGDAETCKEMSERLGQQTIANYSVTTNQGPQRTWSDSDQILGRSLMTPDEIECLDPGECLVMVSGARPRRSKKYNAENHPRYKYIDPVDVESRHRDSYYKEGFNAVRFIKTRRDEAEKEAAAAAARTPRLRRDSPAAQRVELADDFTG